jgi:hypothetical protein
MLCHPSMFSSSCVSSRLFVVKRCAFHGSSHSGWCWLKSPIHAVSRGVFTHCCLSLSCMYMDTWVSELLLLQSLYIFSNRSILKFPCISMAVISGCSMCICFHESVMRLTLIRITNHVWSRCFWCVFR